jgi:arylsulfatase A-like enzyme
MFKHKIQTRLGAPLMAALALHVGGIASAAQPNVVLIMTDDQGYADIGAHGHPFLQTPNMDRLARAGVSLGQFHVDPTCSPTRAALMTGRYSGRVGVWHTVMGRNLVREDETTIAELFRDNGYRTAIFGKWHLGDNYPYGARFRGFDDEAIVHYGGGAGQTPDYWGNDYFEDHYNNKGEWEPYQGYCTDVWFREALRFVRDSQRQEQPFFLYLPTNAAHQTRVHVAERYRALYDHVDVPEQMKIFWGMISNIDDNLGVFLDRLERWGLMDNTVIVFMGDNGTQSGPNWWPQGKRPKEEVWSGWLNAGMRGNKSSQYDGGHRVFGFVHYPPAGISGGRVVSNVTAHIDILPTLLELASIPVPAGLALDGKSLVPLLRGNADGWPQRTLFVQNQRILHPEKWRETAVLTDQWRLVDDRELYDIGQDPGQRRNVIAGHPAVAAQLRQAYDAWWADIGQRFGETTPLYIGSVAQPVVQLNAHDWMTEDVRDIPWNQPHILDRPATNGPWQVRVARSGRYAFTLRERPEQARYPLTAAHARLQIGQQFTAEQAVASGATAVEFEAQLTADDIPITTWLVDADGTTRGAYFVEVRYLGP